TPVAGEYTVSAGCGVVAVTAVDALSKIAVRNGELLVATTRANRSGTGHTRTPPRASPEITNGWSGLGGESEVSRTPWPLYDAMRSVTRSMTVTVPLPPAATM